MSLIEPPTAPQIVETPGNIQRNLNLCKAEAVSCYTNPYRPIRSKPWKSSSYTIPQAPSSFAGSCGFPWVTPHGDRAVPLQDDNFDKRALEESKLFGLVPLREIYLPQQRDSPLYAPANQLNYRLDICELSSIPTRDLKWRRCT